jgi:hypothetical protein
MVNAINPPRLVSNEKPHHRLLVELLASRLLVDVTVDLASPLPDVTDRRFLTSPCFVWSLPIESLRGETISYVRGGENSFSP